MVKLKIFLERKAPMYALLYRIIEWNILVKVIGKQQPDVPGLPSMFEMLFLLIARLALLCLPISNFSVSCYYHSARNTSTHEDKLTRTILQSS